MQLICPYGDGTGGNKDHFISHVLNIGKHHGKLIHFMQLAVTKFICEGGSSHLYYDSVFL